jgi:hypothetical protein
LKLFSIAKKFQTSKNALAVAWGVAPYPTLLLKKERRKLFYRLRRVVKLVKLFTPRKRSFREIKVFALLFSKSDRGGGAEPHGLERRRNEGVT